MELCEKLKEAKKNHSRMKKLKLDGKLSKVVNMEKKVEDIEKKIVENIQKAKQSKYFKGKAIVVLNTIK